MMARSVSHNPGPAPAPAPVLGPEAAPEAGAPEDARLELPLSALMPDSNGEVVLMADGGLGAVAILTDARPVARGLVDAHVTAGGVDVGGFRFMGFESGLTLYYPPALDLHLAAERA